MKAPVVNFGIAGWPLRRASAACLDAAFRAGRASIIEIPKDLLDTISVKQLFRLVKGSGKDPCLAGTTDFARLDSLDWADYRRYLDIQMSYARFLGCSMVRLFLQADSKKDFEVALRRVDEYAQHAENVEIVLETHGGWESGIEGLAYLLAMTRFRLVVDLANVPDQAAREALLNCVPGDRIAYFHVRNLPGHCEIVALAEIERLAAQLHPLHSFLWEPKSLSGWPAMRVLHNCLDCISDAAEVESAPAGSSGS
jgi:hypothetical protein